MLHAVRDRLTCNGDNHKAMVLAENKEHASLIADLWNAHYKECGECHTFIQGDKVSHVNDFMTKTEKRVLVVIYRLTEGFDCKEVSVVAIFRNVDKKSRVYFSQFVGRAVRKLDKDDPITATVISSFISTFFTHKFTQFITHTQYSTQLHS